MKNNYLDIQKQFQEEQKRLKACRTKEDLNKLFAGRTIVIQDGSDWHGERTEFVEMVGEGERKNWKMKVRTQFGTFIELKGGEGMIVAQTIMTTQQEAQKIYQGLKKDGAKDVE